MKEAAEKAGGGAVVLATTYYVPSLAKPCSFNPPNIALMWVLKSPANMKVRPRERQGLAQLMYCDLQTFDFRCGFISPHRSSDKPNWWEDSLSCVA